MKVFIVIYPGDYNCHDDVLGVFDSRLKAETFVKTARHKYHGDDEYHLVRDGGWILEMEVI